MTAIFSVSKNLVKFEGAIIPPGVRLVMRGGLYYMLVNIDVYASFKESSANKVFIACTVPNFKDSLTD